MEIKEIINNFLKNQTNENFSNVIEALMDSNVILVNTKLTGNLKRFGDNGVFQIGRNLSSLYNS